jgi:hypothetical protein
MKASSANRFGQAIVLGCENPGENGRPLTELQKCDVAAMILMCYYDFVSDVEASLSVDIMWDEESTVPNPMFKINRPDN